MLFAPDAVTRRVAAWKRVTRGTSAFAVVSGALVLFGWIFDIRFLKSIAPDLPVMVPNTALCLVLCGLALGGIGREPTETVRRRLGQGCALLSGLLALLTLAEYGLHHSLGLDLLLVRSPSAFPGNTFPGRPSPQTALALFLLSGALAALAQQTDAAQRAAQLSAITAMLIALTALVGYLNHLAFFYGVSAATGMALHTLLLCLALSLGILCAHPERAIMAAVVSDSAGGIMARRLLPAIILVPLLLSWLRHLGENRGVYSAETGVSLMILVTITALMGLLLASADGLNALDARRWKAEEALQQANGTLERRVEERTAEIEALNLRLTRSMTETHHRVKNNLQVISAMIEMRMAEYQGELSVPVEAYQQLQVHVQTLAIVHDLLTKGIKEEEGEQRISAQAVLERLLPMLQQMAWNKEVRYTIGEAQLTTRQGISLALILNELVTNALKHGKREAEVSFRTEAGQGLLEVSDDGPGFPAGFQPLEVANTGLELVESLLHTDLRGQASFETRRDGGGRVLISFPLPDEGKVTASL